MKIFSNKNMLFKLIISLCIFLTLLNFGLPHKVQAGWLFDTAEGAVETGGKLLTPIIDLVLTLADGIVDILQQAVMGTESAITIDTVAKTIIGIITAAVAIAIVAAISIIAAPLVAAIGTILATIVIGTAGVLTLGGLSYAYTGLSGAVLPDYTVLPTYSISPEEIFKGEVLLFDVNIFNPKELYVRVHKDSSETTMKASEWNKKSASGGYTNSYRNSGYEEKYYYYHKDGNPGNNADNNIIVTSANNSAAELRGVVAKWYYAIRNIAIIGLMVVLLYVGIRMMISTTASEKSKYKEMIGDWVVAMCLIFIMQYIMVFANNVTENISLLFSAVADENQYATVIKDAEDELIEGVQEAGMGSTVSGKDIIWPSNLMGKARMMAQEHNGTTGYVGYALCFLVLVIYTVIFTITYAKRLLYIVFFTIISPLVALTYPIDKINDGKAQAFNMWLKEYIFNLLIQPFHLLLYTVLISTAFDLAGTNIIYTLVAMGFMIPAEKFLRKMFGFEKASTPGFLNGAAGGALAMHGLQTLQKIVGKGSKDSKNQDTGKIDFMDRSGNSGEFKTDKMLRSLGGPVNEEQQKEESSEEKETRPVPTIKPPQEGEPNSRIETTTNSDDSSEEEQERSHKIETTPPQSDMPNNEGIENDDIRTFDLDDEPEILTDEQKRKQEEELKRKQQRDALLNYPQMPWLGEEGERFDNFKKKAITTVAVGAEYGKSRWKNFKKAAWDDGFKDKDARNKALRNAVRTVAKTTGTLSGGIIGAASDIASNSFGKDTAAGAIAGGAIGAGAAGGIMNRMEQSEINARKSHEETLKEMYGDDYSTYIKQRKDDIFKKDSNMREMYAREFSTELDGIKNKKEKRQKLDAIMNAAVEYRKYGVKDNGTIIKAMKMEKGNETNWTDKERIAAAKLSGVSKTEKDLQTTLKRFKETPGISKPQVEAMERRIRQINDL